MAKLIFWTMSVCLVMTAAVGLVGAQEEKYEPVYSGLPIVFFEWSMDSESVRFETYYSLDDTAEWFLYKPSTHIIEPNDVILHSDIRLRLEKHPTAPLPNFEGDNALIYPSPNNRFAVYATNQGDPEYYRLAITDITTGQAIIIDSIQPRFASVPTYFFIKWSESSQAFFVEVVREVLIYYYYIDISHGLDKIEEISLYGENSDFHIETGGQIARVYDIDTTGRFLLIEGGTNTQNPEAQGLVVLDMVDYSSIQVASIRRSFAAFDRNDDRKTNYITMDGIYEYDRRTQRTRLRNTSINTSWADSILFSPDGRYIASVSGSHAQYLYVLEIEPTASP